MKRKFINIGYALIASLLFAHANLQAQETSSTDSLVNVAFGTLDKKDVLGAVSSINVSELMKKNYSTNSLDEMQNFVGGYNGTIWGQNGLVLVDGIPRDPSDIQSSEIESITILKGASAVVLYGSRAAKGVTLITTKRGKITPLTIDVRANTGFYVPKAYPKYLGAAEYMTLYNEASRNDGIAERYDAATIYNTAAGTNPYRYPDVNLYSSEYLRKAYNKTDVTAEVTGGNERVRYYSNFGMLYKNGIVKYGEQSKDNDMRFNVRANLDMDITDWLKASADASVVMLDTYRGRGNFWNAASSFRPNWFAPLIPVDMLDHSNIAITNLVDNSNHVIDGKYMLGGTSTDLTNALADMLVAGYVKYKTRTFQFNVDVAANLNMILNGLSFRTAYSVDYRNYYSEAWKIDYAVYQPTWSTMNGEDIITGLTKYNNDTNSNNEYIGDSTSSQTMSFLAQFNYDRIFARDHNVSASVLGWGYQIQDSKDADHDGSSYHRTSNVNLGIRAAYNYQQKYYLDFSGAVVHSAKLPSGNRQAFSPSVTVGYRISDEDFFRNNVSFVDDLKLTASYANLHQDLDISDYYLYKGYYDERGGWYQWRDNSAGGNTTASKRGDNNELTFITRKEWRAGLEASFLNRMITLDANYFVQKTEGGLTQGTNTIFPSYFSRWDYSYLPYINYDKDKRIGFDFTIHVNKKIGQVEATLGLAGMYLKTEVLRRDEVYQDAYQYRTGKPLNSAWGYVCEGFFQNQADIDNHARQTFGEVKPGDLKYTDINDDGVIDSKDEVRLGNGTAPFTFGTNLTLKWKNFTLFAMGTGQTGGYGFKNNSYYWVRGSNKYSEIVRGRWTEATAETATYPRLTTTSNSNNFRNSTFWRYKTNRFDLKRVQLTYDLPQQIFTNTFIKDVSVYVSGENLLTISKERKHMETAIGNAPHCRFYNLGFKASF